MTRKINLLVASICAIFLGSTESYSQKISTDRFTGVSECIIEFQPIDIRPSVRASDFSNFLEIPGAVVIRKKEQETQHQLVLFVMVIDPFNIRRATIDFLLDTVPYRVVDQTDYQMDQDPPIESAIWSLPSDFLESLQQSNSDELRLNAGRGDIEAKFSRDDITKMQEQLVKCLSNDW